MITKIDIEEAKDVLIDAYIVDPHSEDTVTVSKVKWENIAYYLTIIMELLEKVKPLLSGLKSWQIWKYAKIVAILIAFILKIKNSKNK